MHTSLTHRSKNTSGSSRQGNSISFEEASQEYKLTEKGLQFLRVYDEISQMIALDDNKEVTQNPLAHLVSASPSSSVYSRLAAGNERSGRSKYSM